MSQDRDSRAGSVLQWGAGVACTPTSTETDGKASQQKQEKSAFSGQGWWQGPPSRTLGEKSTLWCRSGQGGPTRPTQPTRTPKEAVLGEPSPSPGR